MLFFKRSESAAMDTHILKAALLQHMCADSCVRSAIQYNLNLGFIFVKGPKYHQYVNFWLKH